MESWWDEGRGWVSMLPKQGPANIMARTMGLLLEGCEG